MNKMINFSILIAFAQSGFAQSGSQPSHEYFSRIVQDIKGQEASPRHGKPRGEAYLPTDYIRLFLPSNSDIDPCSNATKLECGVVFSSLLHVCMCLEYFYSSLSKC
jgi:hypothetical protein